MFSKLVTVFVLILAHVSAQGFDCEQIQCNPCEGKLDFIDLAFLLDCTGSMATEIRMVGDGLTAFVLALDVLYPRFAVVLFGTTSEVVVDWTVKDTDGTITPVTDAFGMIQSSTAVPGFALRHFSREAGFETIRMVLDEAPYSILERDNCGCNVGFSGLDWDPRALKYLILVTDEDVDSPHYQLNYEELGLSDSDQHPPVPLPDDPPGWKLERTLTSDAIIRNAAYITMLINRADSPAREQYCDPTLQSQDPDFLNFDPLITLQNLQAGGIPDCLQATVLEAGLLARCFDINDIEDPEFIQNFFLAIAEAAGACEGEASCFTSFCDPDEGCLYDPICANTDARCDKNCFINGTCYSFSAKNPNNECQKCDPGNDRWIDCTDNNACTDDVCVDGVCEFPPTCTLDCNRCLIDGVCYEAFVRARDQDNYADIATQYGQDAICYICDPVTNQTDWTFVSWAGPAVNCQPPPGTEPPCDNLDTCTNADADGDGWDNGEDHCPLTYDPSNQDTDNDGVGDACDPCPTDPTSADNCNAQDEGGDEGHCEGQGTCLCASEDAGRAEAVCSCNEGRIGPFCELDLVSECDQRFQNCRGHGECVPSEADPTDPDLISCDCESEYGGLLCDRDALCYGCYDGQGTCVADSVCICESGWEGPKCDRVACSSDTDCTPYENHVCVLELGYCDCDPLQNLCHISTPGDSVCFDASSAACEDAAGTLLGTTAETNGTAPAPPGNNGANGNADNGKNGSVKQDKDSVNSITIGALTLLSLL